MALRVEAKVDARKGTDEFRAARRDANARMKSGLVAAGEKVALPRARQLAPSKSGGLRSSLVVRSTARSAYLTTSLRGVKGRRVGLLEFGGVLRRTIRPRRAKALYFNGRFAARVDAPRVIKAQGFLSRAVAGQLAAIEQAIRDEVMTAFDGFGE